MLSNECTQTHGCSDKGGGRNTSKWRQDQDSREKKSISAKNEQFSITVQYMEKKHTIDLILVNNQS